MVSAASASPMTPAVTPSGAPPDSEACPVPVLGGAGAGPGEVPVPSDVPGPGRVVNPWVPPLASM